MGAVYIDEAFLINFIMNMLILYTTKRLLKPRTSIMWIAIGAAISALYAVLMFVPLFEPAYTLIGKLSFTMLLVYITFRSKGIKEYIKILCVFYIVSFGFGGAVYGILSLIQYQGQGLPLILLLASAAASYGLITLAASHRRQKLIKERQTVKMLVTFGGKTKEIYGLVDTGNMLYEPISRCPVVVVRQKSVCGLLPGKLLDLLNGSSMDYEAAEAGVSVIPFSSLGQSKGFIYGIRPVVIQIITDESAIEVTNAVLGLYDGELSVDDSYNAIINPQLLEGKGYENFGV